MLAMPAFAHAQVPRGFVGMDLDGPIFYKHVNQARQFKRMVANGVESVRVVFNWSQAEPYPNWDYVPLGQIGRFAADAVPTDFSATDAIVAQAARRHLTVLPVVIYSPFWDSVKHPPSALGIPRRDGPYASYLRLLIGRYGPHGTFWSSHRKIPKIPIRMWQIWNEPNVGHFWPILPSYVPGYVRLLKAAHRAIKRADPKAKVVLAGMPDYVWEEMRKLYKAGAKRYFDVVAIHPYTKDPQGVITIVQVVRQVMDRYGDSRKPIMLTELGWPSARHHARPAFDFEENNAGQASKLTDVLRLIAEYRTQLRLIGFYYYTWIAAPVNHGDIFTYAGLLNWHHGRIVTKPALEAFGRGALALEGCRKKVLVATRCA
jgi:hypothetical protein